MTLKQRVYIGFTVLAGGAFMGMLFLHFGSRLHVTTDIWNDPTVKTATLIGADESIQVTIARTPAEQEQGLSDTLSLPENAGKLFVFTHPDTYGFWMKDMHYGLDFVWIDSAHHIASITPSVGAETYPKVFYPDQPIEYVLEVNAGFSTAHGLRAGQSLALKK
jgi:uncharacterized membrane protein (UPF0127 family)